MLTKNKTRIKMKKLILLMSLLVTTIESFTIDPSGARVDYGESGMNIPTPLLILGLIIATIGCLFMGNGKWEI